MAVPLESAIFAAATVLPVECLATGGDYVLRITWHGADRSVKTSVEEGLHGFERDVLVMFSVGLAVGGTVLQSQHHVPVALLAWNSGMAGAALLLFRGSQNLSHLAGPLLKKYLFLAGPCS